MIPNDFIQTLLGRVDIVEVIDRSVPLRKAGANYVACCPFHREKTPSFTVSPSKQFYHCFGCGAHGTAIGFLMEYGGKPFVEAVEDLARQAGLPVPRAGPSESAEQRSAAARGGELLLAAARFYKQQLKASTRAIDYLKRRGLSGKIAGRYGIGYAPAEWNGLAGAVDDYDDKALEQAGLVISGDAGKRYDRFRDRIMFPILDTRGQVIGFGGRVLDAGEPKYLNSPETPLFSKSRELYGLFQARQAIRDSGRVVVVEGYMDVVALAQFGIENVVATLGTATTGAHAAKLLRYADTVYFCFDGDAAGRRAAWRALEAMLGTLMDGKDVRFLFLPEGVDPDDFVRAHGADAFAQRLGEAVPLSELLMQELCQRHPPGSAETKAALVAAARPYLDQLQAPVLGALLRRRLAELTGLAPHEVGPRKPSPQGADTGGKARVRKPAERPAPSDTRRLLKAVLAFPGLTVDLERADSDPDGDTPEAAALRSILEELADPETARSATTASVLERMRETRHAALLWKIAAQIDIEQLDEGAVRAEMDGVRASRAARREAARVDAILRRSSLADLTAEERALLARFRRSPDVPSSDLPAPAAGLGADGDV